MTQQIGGAIGLAIATAVTTSHTHAAIPDPAALTNGFRSALLVSAAIAAAAILATVAGLPRTERPTVDATAALAAH